MMKKYGFAIIGCGGIAKIHAEAISKIENATLIGVYDNYYQSADNFAKSHNCHAFKDLNELLTCKKVEIVNICTPSGLHAQMAVMAANAGKHIIVEKPMAITEKQIKEVDDAVNRNHVKAEVISQLRFTPAIVLAKQAIIDGKLGRILQADYVMRYNRSQEYYDNGGWRGTWLMDGGGALMNQGIHGIDLLQYLAGEITNVYAVCKTMARKIETEDTANLLVEYKNGAVGVIECSTCCEPGYPRRITISGTNGSIVIKEDEIESWDIDGGHDLESGGGVNVNSDPLNLSSSYHVLQFKDLIQAIESDKEPIVNIEEGRKSVEIILAAYRSSKTGRKVTI